MPPHIKTQRWLRHEINFPELVAYFGIARALRTTVRMPDPLLAVLHLPDKSGMEVYARAARRFLAPRAGLLNVGYRDLVKMIKTQDDAQDALENLKRREVCSSVHLVFDDRLAGENASLAADLTIAIEPPADKHFSAAARLLFEMSIGEEEVRFLMGETWDNLDYAFKKGRSFTSAVRKLREARLSASSNSSPSLLHQNRPGSEASLRHLAGYGDAKEWGLQLARDIEDYREGTLNWSDIDSGVLLSGPPGCGKTTYARALANTCDLPLFGGSLAQWQSQRQGYLGDLLKAMQELFANAKSSAPSILFIDELDSFGSRNELGGGSNASYQRQVVNALLELLDGLQTRHGVIVIGATNDPAAIDPAILRAGRLGKHIAIPLPDGDDRIRILKHHLPCSLSSTDEARIAAVTGGWTGADIKQLTLDAKSRARKMGVKPSASHVLDCQKTETPYANGSTPDFRTRSSRSEKLATSLSTVSATCDSRRGQGHALRS